MTDAVGKEKTIPILMYVDTILELHPACFLQVAFSSNITHLSNFLGLGVRVIFITVFVFYIILVNVEHDMTQQENRYT